ncbi:MAG: hypothetical protein H6579_11025 [Chitinophagales bacterium]|nr:hypothetical protein [Bacteroidota bacterium]MCB9257652.1 hypothetical protein [Chitinophagales bacterium]
MKKFTLLIPILLSLLFFNSCSSNTEQLQENETSTNLSEEVQETTPSIDKEELMAITDTKRLLIEGLTLEAYEVSTENLREKIKQKWSKIHFYVQNGLILKVKTYPYEGISNRTEEFYADESGLILVVIEDNGQGEKGKAKDELDKMYYFHLDELVLELSKENEAEFSVRNGDAEELLAEFKEYQEIYQQMQK